MRRLSISGIVTGGIADFICSSLLGLPIMFYMLKTHVPATSLSAELYVLLAGIIGSAVGGYIAARVSLHDEVLNGALSSYLGVALGIYAWVTAPASLPVAFRVAAMIAGVLFAAVGGYIRLQTKRPGARTVSA